MSVNVEALLIEALAPVEPPPALLSEQIEIRLATITGAAQDELEGWELATMRDPRNWGRPVAAAVITATAGTALVALRVRSRHNTRVQQSSSLREFAGRTLQDIAEEARRVLPDMDR
jgi:hypothetical protein